MQSAVNGFILRKVQSMTDATMFNHLGRSVVVHVRTCAIMDDFLGLHYPRAPSESLFRQKLDVVRHVISKPFGLEYIKHSASFSEE